MSPAVVDGLSVNLRVQIRSFKPTCIFPFFYGERGRVFVAVGAQGIHITIDVVANKLRSTAGKGYKKTAVLQRQGIGLFIVGGVDFGETVGIVGHDAVGAVFNEHAHFGGVVDRPVMHGQIVRVGAVD